jgi:hypothetical protein
MMMDAYTLRCDRCGEPLDAEAMVAPRTEHHGLTPICDACYREQYEEPCSWCEEYFETPATRRFFGVFDHEAVEAPLPGFYRIVYTPFYTQPLIGQGWISPSAVQWVGFLPDRLVEPDGYPCGFFCPACEQRALEYLHFRTCCGIAALT